MNSKCQISAQLIGPSLLYSIEGHRMAAECQCLLCVLTAKLIINFNLVQCSLFYFNTAEHMSRAAMKIPHYNVLLSVWGWLFIHHGWPGGGVRYSGASPTSVQVLNYCLDSSLKATADDFHFTNVAWRVININGHVWWPGTRECDRSVLDNPLAPFQRDSK